MNRTFSRFTICGVAACLLLTASAGWAQSRARGKTPEIYKDYKAIEVSNGGTIEGVILYKGEVPPPEKIAIVKDQETCKHHPVERARIIVNDAKQVKDAVVFLNIKEGKAGVKDKKARIDQKSCEFEPHVQVMEVGQPFEITNSDPVLHNIQANQKLSTLFNHVQSNQGMKQEERFKEPGLVSVMCQAHPWMKGWVYVLPHPYHAVTGANGAFKITDVPPGEYQLHLWQETLGEQVIPVTVKAGETTKIEYEMKKETRRRAS